MTDADTAADFAKFHAANRHVYKTFKECVRERWNAGSRHESARQIFEDMRRDAKIRTAKGREIYKLNNNYIPLYARMLMVEWSFLAETAFFQLRGRDVVAAAAAKQRDAPRPRGPSAVGVPVAAAEQGRLGFLTGRKWHGENL